ncbi:hypothetical protein BKA70DRAFT_1427310 [Coprinopsis sp. MPI-PUGE-AT-0042]|nr:hypothetical protein BKA70DRAFT_1434510 [Coprinopsis sp. MPI-PUGE-AT-0042]KAH6908065.1 hypothetical protein BKA70DRAFT_1427310 [Coprinopsis sp. MPI-PUGE-AT-0042]
MHIQTYNYKLPTAILNIAVAKAASPPASKKRSATSGLLSYTRFLAFLAAHAGLKGREQGGELKVSRDTPRQMSLFRYFEGKDISHAFCTTKLSKQHTHGASASGKHEASIIFKLKEA